MSQKRICRSFWPQSWNSLVSSPKGAKNLLAAPKMGLEHLWTQENWKPSDVALVILGTVLLVVSNTTLQYWVARTSLTPFRALTTRTSWLSSSWTLPSTLRDAQFAKLLFKEQMVAHWWLVKASTAKTWGLLPNSASFAVKISLELSILTFKRVESSHNDDISKWENFNII